MNDGNFKLSWRERISFCAGALIDRSSPRWDGGYRGNFSKELWGMAVGMIREIIDTARPKRTKFSIESMPWMIPSSPDEYLRLLEEVNPAMPMIIEHLCEDEEYIDSVRYIQSLESEAQM